MSPNSIAPPSPRASWSAVAAGLRRVVRRTAVTVLVGAGALIGLAAPDTGTARAQGGPAPAILIDGNAVVTGFSGTQPPLPFPPAMADQAGIDLNGPAARIMDLQAPGAPPQAQLLTAPKPFTVLAGQVGQVFAVALDGATPPNIYLAATSSYGLPIVAPGPGGALMRAKQGGPNASFMPGLFGPAAAGGGPGSIWRVDGVTGAVSLFANVSLDGVENSGPALGGLAYDPGSDTLFVADRETGMIHRFGLDGKERGRFDQGVQGRMAAGLPTVAYDPATRLDISNPQFRPDDPATWGYAPLERQIYGLAVRSGRLYYAVADGLQVWSVAISPDGTFGADPRREVQVSPWDGGSEISKITFDNPGRMLLAERPAPTGAYDFGALAKPGVGRVLRYRSVPAAGGGNAWSPEPDEYAIGFADQMRNGNGGVAIGYGYSPNGQIDHAACSAFLWSTGEQLRKAMDPALMTRLAASGPAIVNGLQGNALALVRPANVPPLQSYFVDYDDQFSDDSARGHHRRRRDLAHLRPGAGPGAAGRAVRADRRRWRWLLSRWRDQAARWPVLRSPRRARRPLRLPARRDQAARRPVLRSPRRARRPLRLPARRDQIARRPVLRSPQRARRPLRLPARRDHVARRPVLRSPQRARRSLRVARPTRSGCATASAAIPATCATAAATAAHRRDHARRPLRQPPSCPPGEIMRDGRCVQPPSCPPGQIMRDGRCVQPPSCPPGQIMRDGRCVQPPSCPPGQIMRDGHCVQPPTITRTPLRHLKVEEPREPGRHVTTFHTRIPSGVTVGRTPSSGGRGTISMPRSGGVGRTLR